MSEDNSKKEFQNMVMAQQLMAPKAQESIDNYGIVITTGAAACLVSNLAIDGGLDKETLLSIVSDAWDNLTTPGVVEEDGNATYH